MSNNSEDSKEFINLLNRCAECNKKNRTDVFFM